MDRKAQRRSPDWNYNVKEKNFKARYLNRGLHSGGLCSCIGLMWRTMISPSATNIIWLTSLRYTALCEISLHSFLSDSIVSFMSQLTRYLLPLPLGCLHYDQIAAITCRRAAYSQSLWLDRPPSPPQRKMNFASNPTPHSLWPTRRGLRNGGCS